MLSQPIHSAGLTVLSSYVFVQKKSKEEEESTFFSLWHTDSMPHHLRQEMALCRAGQLCSLLGPVINTCTWCPYRHWASFHPTWTPWGHIPHFTSTLPTTVPGQASSFSQSSNGTCQSKQKVATAMFPWKFPGGRARLTPGIPSHWGNNWHSWDREKQTSQNMFWWSLPMRWCLWRAAVFVLTCSGLPLPLFWNPGYHQNDQLLPFSFLQHHGKCWRLSLHNFYMIN